jgi:(E)-4-hydroxy-3-methylbut-2-enyl-diphosphate synthase
MTNTLTADIDASVEQVSQLYQAGSAMVRLTVNDDDAARAVPDIKRKLLERGLDVPLVGDFHYNGHLLLTRYPDCARALAKYRINPGNVGYGDKHDSNFAQMILVAIEHNKPVRIGVNWGSLDQELFTQLMDANSRGELSLRAVGEAIPLTTREVIYEAMITSALSSAKAAEALGLSSNNIIISVKMSEAQDLINVYQRIAPLCTYPLHLGLTEAGTAINGMIASSAAMGILLQQGIGDTIRMSLTPSVDAGQLSDRTLEVRACQQLLQSLELAYFKPSVTSCPGCGRTTSNYFQKLADDINDYTTEMMPVWAKNYPGVEKLKIAVMGCIVNGPGESKYADIGISLPGNNEDPAAPVYVEGSLVKTLRGDNIAAEFKMMLDDYVASRFSSPMSLSH